MNYAGLIYDDSSHYLDHLAPFCALLNCPLIICEPSLAKLAKQYYPDLEVIEQPFWNLKLPPRVITCDNEPLLQASFPHQKCQVLWLPHGNSDKGGNSPLFESVKEIAFVYGQQMSDRMSAQHILRVGNFRFEYFLKHQEFYRNLITLPQQGKNILYAPTWEDGESNGSFWRAFPHLASNLPHDCNLLVKLHPNTMHKFAMELVVLMGRYAQKNIFFLNDIPPIYPMLYQSDAYIGDMSSIGYDFLTFDRPLYFLNAKLVHPLHRCGHAIEPHTFCLQQDPFSPLRKAAYQHTFDPIPNWDLLREQVNALTHSERGG